MTVPGSAAQRLAVPAAAPAGLPTGAVLAALVALLALWLAGLGLAPLLDVDEGAFGEASREMLASGDWGHTTLNGEDRFDKPILVYWLQAASMALFGATAFAARLPSALCAVGWCLAAAAFVLPRFGRAAAALAGGMLATSLGPMLIGRAATADALLNLLLALALFDLWRTLDAPTAAAPRRRAFLWIGLGVLAKGPVAVLLPGAALLLWVLLAPGPDRPWPALRALLADPLAWLIGSGVALPWYAYAVWRHGQAFIDGFFVRHNLERFSGPLEGHGGSLGYYLLALPLLMLPWSAWLWPVLRGLRAVHTGWRDPLSRWLLGWAGFVLVFFSLSGTKLPHYALYGLTPLVVLCVRHAEGAPRGVWVLTGALAAASWAAALSSPAIAAWLAPRVADGQWLLRLASTSVESGLAFTAVAVGVGLVLLLTLTALLLQPAAQRVGALLAAAAVAASGWTLAGLPWWANTLQAPVRLLAERARQEGWPMVQWQLHQPSAGFYRGQPAPRRAPAPGEAALMRAERLEALPAAEREALTVVAREGGFALVRRQP
jgi:4-amino-4-deoxy-L-arabinose transferase-like glycosyltransferase